MTQQSIPAADESCTIKVIQAQTDLQYKMLLQSLEIFTLSLEDTIESSDGHLCPRYVHWLLTDLGKSLSKVPDMDLQLRQKVILEATDTIAALRKIMPSLSELDERLEWISLARSV